MIDDKLVRYAAQLDSLVPHSKPCDSDPHLPLDVAIANVSGVPLTLDQALRFQDFIVARRQYDVTHPSDWKRPDPIVDPWDRWVRDVNDGVEPSDEEILAARGARAHYERELLTE
jgi:hypothetical protein